MCGGDFVDAEGLRTQSRPIVKMTGILYFKRNSGGCVIFGWNCALQDVSSHASQTSALRLIDSGK
jgi:hypothetical protein